ncbi:MAG: hypothetical protein H6626_05850 [Pseudobdellovibrionaceae bacterium]|nr:hypothetical protein [Bdellovibrionales bacterium]USN48617.1 MAG: hypothetical protein H6626_05850 [Pseudobdellovibrionaceae bacterium]
MIRVFTTLYVVISISACATIKDTHQLIKVPTDVDGAMAYYQGAKLGPAPNFYKVRRHKAATLALRHQDKFIEQKLTPKYRWGESFGSNMLMGLFFGNLAIGAVGVAADMVSGTAYDFSPIEPFVFYPDRTRLRAPRSIAVAPPKYSDEFISDQLALRVNSFLETEYPQKSLITYAENERIFFSYGYTHDQWASPVVRDRLYQTLGTTHLAETIVSEEQDSFSLEIKITDVITNLPFATHTVSIKKNELSAFNMGRVSRWFRKLAIEMVPNAAGIENLKASFSISGDQEDAPLDAYYFLNSGSPVGLLGSNLSVTMSNLRPANRRGNFDGVVRLQSKFSFQYQPFYVEDLFGDKVFDFDWWNVGYGLGPEVGLDTMIGYLYLNVLLTPTMHHISFGSPVPGKDISRMYMDGQAEFGFSTFLATHWHMRFFVRTRNHSPEMWHEILNQGADVPRGSEPDVAPFYNYSGIGIEYYLPRARKEAKRWLNP